MTAGLFWRVLAILAGLLCNPSLIAIEQYEYKEGNGLPNISTRPENQSSNFYVFADVLVWCARESGADNWAQVFSTRSVSAEKLDIDILEVSFDWDVGFRLGIDYGMKHDQWDTLLYYTWFRTQGTDHASTNKGQIASSFYANFYVGNADGSGNGPSYQNASIKWTILFNVLDLELGRNYRVSSALSLRPFIGLKSGWIHQTIDSKWRNPIPTPSIPNHNAFGTATEKLKNDYWGIGPSVGLNSKWKLYAISSHEFSLFGDFSGSLMFGHWSFGDVYKNAVPEEVSVKVSNINGGSTMLRTFLGLGWDSRVNKERFRFSARVGYEMQFWLSQLQFYSFNTGRLVNGLTLQGATIDFRFDF